MKTWDEMVEAAAKAFNGEVRDVDAEGRKINPATYHQATYGPDLPDMYRALGAALADQPRIHVEGGMMVRDTHRGHVTLVDMTEIPRPGWYVLVPIPPG